MRVFRMCLVLLVLAALQAPGARAACSTDAVDAVRLEMRAAHAPSCGSRAIRHAFDRARNRTARLTARIGRDCARGRTPRLAPAQNALGHFLRKLLASGLDDPCIAAFEIEVARLEADLEAAVAGAPTTTSTTIAPGGSTTTTLPVGCVKVMLEVDRGDCGSVTSVPGGLVQCGAACNVQTFVVPGIGTLRLAGTPAPGDTDVLFGTDCDDDGTVPLSLAFPPSCSLSCDCTSF